MRPPKLNSDRPNYIVCPIGQIPKIGAFHSGANFSKLNRPIIPKASNFTNTTSIFQICPIGTLFQSRHLGNYPKQPKNGKLTKRRPKFTNHISMESPRDQELISTITLVKTLLWWPENSIQQSANFIFVISFKR